MTGPVRLWRAGSREISLDHPIVMGILNVTPDRFSDGGNSVSLDAALDHAARMIDEGVDIIDVSGESTLPGATPVPADDEIRRVVPVLSAVREKWPSMPLAIDTVKTSVARAALDAGADVINEVSAMHLDPVMPILAGQSKCGLVLLHSRGGLQDMATYAHADYKDVTTEVIADLRSRIAVAEKAGVDRKSVVVDPGFGFSKRSEHSMELLRKLDRFSSLGVPVAVGVSRKRFVREAARITDEDDERSDEATTAVNVMALERGASIFRVHNVGMARRALDAAWAIAGSGNTRV